MFLDRLTKIVCVFFFYSALDMCDQYRIYYDDNRVLSSNVLRISSKDEFKQEYVESCS